MKCVICTAKTTPEKGNPLSKIICSDCRANIRLAEMKAPDDEKVKVYNALVLDGESAITLAKQIGYTRTRIYQIRNEVEAFLRGLARFVGLVYERPEKASFPHLLGGFAITDDQHEQYAQALENDNLNHSQFMRKVLAHYFETAS